MFIVILLLTVAFPIAWFCSEFSALRWLRITLGLLALLMSFGVAFIVGSLERFNSNIWFGDATKQLIDTTITELDAGHTRSVLQALKQLQAEYSPTYENRAVYDILVKQTVERMQ